MISGGPETPRFLGKDDAKIWKGGESCARAHMQLLISLMDAHFAAAAVFEGDYGRCSFASTRLCEPMINTEIILMGNLF